MTDRGSFNFWANLSRARVAHNLLDSGRIYGYQHDRPKPAENEDPIKLEFHDRHLEYATVSLAHVLNQTLDAADPVAVALETLLYAAPGYLWNDAVEWLQDNLEGMLEYIEEGESGHAFLREWYADWPEQSEEVRGAVVTVSEWIQHDDLVFGAGFYTYNHENSLDQDFSVNLFIGNEEMYGDQYVIVRTHNGCDARGGFSNPVVARVRDNDYFHFCWDADVYCNECGTTWESTYDYLNDETDWPTNADVEQWAERIRLINEEDAGQSSFAPVPAWDFQIPIEVAVDVISALAEDPDVEPADVLPKALVKGAPVSGSPTTDNCDTALLCPNCRAYTAWVGNSVAYGF